MVQHLPLINYRKPHEIIYKDMEQMTQPKQEFIIQQSVGILKKIKYDQIH
jgi:hypothetical protein